MTLITWIPALALTAIGLIGFLFRQSLLAWLTRRVAHHFDRDIEQIRSDLRERESQIQNLTQDALSGASSRRSLLYQRRLQAIECLWTDISALTALRFASAMLAVVNVKEVAKRIEKEPALRRFFETIAQPYDIKNFPKLLADKERPFISDNIWKLYSVYRGLLFHAVIQIKVFEIGLDARKYTSTSNLNEQIKAAVPAFCGVR